MFSNNAIEADRLILEESLQQLQRLSAIPLQIEMAEEAEAPMLRGQYALVLTMAQDSKTLDAIEKNLADSPVWNSVAAIRNCYRKTMSRILSALPVGYVPFELVATDTTTLPKLAPDTSYWLKRSDFHAISDEDVTLAESAEEMRSKLASFRGRGVEEVIVQRHVHGDIYKFYGVKGKFFRPIRVRGFLPSPPSPDFSRLEQAAVLSAEAMGLMIYGGDAILDQDGKFHLIDLNDWPSFRICRDDAARAIAELSFQHLAGPRTEKKAPLAAASVSCV